MSEDDDTDLVRSAAGRDSRGLAGLYDRHVVSVYRYSLSLLGSVPDAEDVTQEVFIVAWRRAATIRLVGQSALPWLLVTARYCCANRRRTLADERRRHFAGDMASQIDPHASPEFEVERRQLQNALAHAVSQLSALDQQLYVLCFEEGMTYEAAAASLDLSHGAVRNRVFRLRATLRRQLDPPARQEQP